MRTQGIEWKSVPGSEATVQYGQGRVQVDNLRLASGDQALTVNGAFAMQGESPAGAVKVQAANVDLQQLQTLLLTDRGLSGKLSAAATISGTAKAPVVDGHVEVVNGAFQSYKYQSLTADLDYTGDRIGVDATLQQSPTEAITAKGSVPMTLFKPGTGEHVDESAKDTVDLHVKSTALNLGIVQGFTTQVTDVSGTLEADVHVTGSGQDPHLQGFVDIKGGAFGVPAGGVSYSGLNTRIDLEPDKVRLQKFAILDEHGQPLNVSGELAVHARQVGAVNIAIDSDNFEVIDNELGDVGIDSKLTVTGELRRPQIRGTIRLEAARLEVDRILQLFYDPYSVEELPPVVSAERTAESAGSAQEATAAALKRAETTAAVPGTRAQAEAGTAPAPGGAFAPVELDLRLRDPGQPRAARQEAAAGRPDRRVARRHEHHRRRRSAGRQAGRTARCCCSARSRRCAAPTSSRAAASTCSAAARCGSSASRSRIRRSTSSRRGPSRTPASRPACAIQGTAKAPQLTLTSNPPLEESDILALIVFNRPVNELGTARRPRWRRRPAASPPASSPRRWASRSAARSTSICSRSPRPRTTASSGPG